MDTLAITYELTAEELGQLRQAKLVLETPALPIRLARLIGMPVEKALLMLPKGWKNIVHRSVALALRQSLNLAIGSLQHRQSESASPGWHQGAVGLTGAIGGTLGLLSLPVELPISTTIMLRSIADIAQSEGHSLKELNTRLSCLEVFALGGGQPSETSNNHYWIIRASLAQTISDTTLVLADRALEKETVPVAVRLINAVASRFGIVVSNQTAAKAVPLIGAATSASINLIFIRHFQRLARMHFTVKRLEKKYGPYHIENLYRSIAVPVSSAELAQDSVPIL